VKEDRRCHCGGRNRRHPSRLGKVGRGGDEVTVPAAMRRLQGGAATPDPPPVGRSPLWSGLTSTAPWE
jgi:hypothetical protein